MRETPREVDVLVIGAGVAGGIAALQCARAGLGTLLVERCTLPRAKVCGCCMAPSGVNVLKRLGLASTLADAVEVRRFELSMDGARVALPMPRYRVQSREVLDQALAKAACASGVRLPDSCTARVVDVGDDRGDRFARVALTRGGEEWTCDARVVLACDGIAGSSLSDVTQFAWSISSSSRMGLGAIVDADFVPPGVLRMACEQQGYVGQVRLPDGRVAIASAAEASAVRDAGDPGAFAAGVLERAGFDASGIERASWKGTPLLTRRRGRVACGRVLAVGDAAGYVEPFTGEGMSWAMRGAEAAAGVAIAMRRADASAQDWTRAHAALVGRAHRACGWVSRALRSRTLRGVVGALGTRVPSGAASRGSVGAA